jgi:hypothetical protein
MKIGIAGVGVLAPGLPDWATAAAILRGESSYMDTPLVEPATVPANLRRRASLGTRLAIATTFEATSRAQLPPQSLATVFASSNGSGTEVTALLEALAQPGMPVSPTHFHNSVHNAAVGYWCITAGAQAPSASVAAHDQSFVSGLLKAAAQVDVEGVPVVLTTFDAPFPAPLHAVRAIHHPMSVSLVLVPDSARASHVVEVEIVAGGAPAPATPTAWLGALVQSNPAGRALSLLALLANNSGNIRLPCTRGMSVDLRVWTR